MFNHNEALLYCGSKEHEPELSREFETRETRQMAHFRRVVLCSRTVTCPAVSLCPAAPLRRHSYFWKKFGVKSEVAANLILSDIPRGLVQILRKAGFKGYLFCRPYQEDCPLPNDDFTWVGYDGSTVIGLQGFRPLQFLFGKS